MTYERTHISHNENGREQVEFEYYQTIMQKLFKKPRTVKSFENILGKWCDKKTGMPVDVNTYKRITDFVNWSICSRRG